VNVKRQPSRRVHGRGHVRLHRTVMELTFHMERALRCSHSVLPYYIGCLCISDLRLAFKELKAALYEMMYKLLRAFTLASAKIPQGGSHGDQTGRCDVK
jgi:hypothetical protein